MRHLIKTILEWQFFIPIAAGFLAVVLTIVVLFFKPDKRDEEYFGLKKKDMKEPLSPSDMEFVNRERAVTSDSIPALSPIIHEDVKEDIRLKEEARKLQESWRKNRKKTLEASDEFLTKAGITRETFEGLSEEEKKMIIDYYMEMDPKQTPKNL